MEYIIQNEYMLPVTVATYDVGPTGELRLSAILRYQQEVAERHFAAGHLGWQALAREGLAFVTSRWRCRITRLPQLGEKLTLHTWHRDRRGPRFFRCYDWRDEAGTTVLSGVMQFALVSTEEHRLLKGEVFDRFGLQNQPEKDVDCPEPAKYPLPPLTAKGSYTVGRSDMDLSHHMNNTRYGDLLWDALPETFALSDIREVQMHFAGECRLGDALTLAAAVEADAAYAQVNNPRGTACTAKLTLEQRHGI